MRDERVFDVAQVDPGDAEWGTLRLVRQVLVIGQAADPWMADVLGESPEPAPTPPAVLQVPNVWARGQLVTAILLPPGSSLSAASPLLPEVGALLLEQRTRFARVRMFVAGADSALADSLRAAAGFSILVPTIYRVGSPRRGVVVLRNDNPDPADLIREVVVDSRPADPRSFTAAGVVEWRAALARELHDPPQLTADTTARARRIQVRGEDAMEVQGTWLNDPTSWPAGGPFITRLVRCGDRAFLIDAWLYAPGRPKFEYMVQLQTILDSFACAA